MVMGVPSNTAKVPFCPCSSSVGGSSFRYLSLGSSKALRRREACIIQSAYKSFPEISMLTSLPRFHRSCYHVRTSAKEKYNYVLMTDASPAKMIPLYQCQNFFDKRHSSREIINQQKLNEKREQVSRNCSTSPIQDFLGKPTFPRKNRSSTLKDWDEVTENLRRNRKQALDQIKTECLQDDSTYTASSGLFFSEQSSSENSKWMDKSDSRDQTNAGKVSWRDVNFKCHATFVPADTAEKIMRSNNKAALNHVNGGISKFGKRNLHPVDLLEKENVMVIPKEIMDDQEEARLKLIVEKEPIVEKEARSKLIVEEEDNPVKKVHPKKTPQSSSVVETTIVKEDVGAYHPDLRKKLATVYKDVMVIDNIADAKKVVKMLTTQYKHLVHACDTEVANIDVKQETPVDHGEVICFSIYSGPDANFGSGKSCIWVDVLDGGGNGLLTEFAPFFEDPSIKKVWHNYSFDNHVVENYGIKLSGFHADTMHMARLWDSSRRTVGGYSLEALTGDARVMSGAKMRGEKDLLGKISMKTIFGRKKLKKDGTEGKIIIIPPVEELQREEREPWICYSALDAISTLKLYESLRKKLEKMPWKLEWELGTPKKSMFDFYLNYWQPFGEILIKMETEGMLVDRNYLAEIEKVAKAQQEVAVNRFRNWASKKCPDAMYMNVGSDTQLRQLLFGGISNRKDFSECLPYKRVFKVPNTEQVIEEGKKTPSKYRNIQLRKIGGELPTEMYTASGWPSVSGDALKLLAGNISAEYDWTEETDETVVVDDGGKAAKAMTSKYGTAYEAFGGGKEGKEACHAIASLCEVCSIDSLISNFILPLQGSNVSGKNGRVHCSLNINTETGRLSARRPNLQNQPALEKDRYKIRQAFIASPGNSLIVADYGQLELRILAHLANCKSMLDAFKAGGDFHSRTAMNMYPHIRHAIDTEQVILEWHPEPGQDKPPVPLLKDAFGSERRKAKMLNFSIAYGKTPVGLARDWKVSVEEAKNTVDLWYGERQEVLAWQEARKEEARRFGCVHTLLGRARRFPSLTRATRAQKNHIERAAINTPVQGSAADVAMCAMLEISKNARLKELGWTLLLQVHDEVILEGPSESAEIAKDIVVDCMSKPFDGKNILKVDLSVDAKCAQNWYAAK